MMMIDPFDNQKKSVRNKERQANLKEDIFTSDNPCQQRRMTLKRDWEIPEGNQEHFNIQSETIKSTAPQSLNPLTIDTLPIPFGRNWTNCSFIFNQLLLPFNKFYNTKSCKTMWSCSDKNKNYSNSFAVTKPKEKMSECSDSHLASITCFCFTHTSSSSCFNLPDKHASHPGNSKHLLDKPHIQGYRSLPSHSLQLERYLNKCFPENHLSQYFSRILTSPDGPLYHFEIFVKHMSSFQTLLQKIQKIGLKYPVFLQGITYFAPENTHYQNINVTLSSPLALHPNEMDELTDNKFSTSLNLCTTNGRQCLQSCSDVLILNKDVECPCNATLTQPLMNVSTDDSTEFINVSEIQQGSASYCLSTSDSDVGATEKNVHISSCNGTSIIKGGDVVSLNKKNEISEDSSLSLNDEFVPDCWDDGLFTDEDDEPNDSKDNYESHSFNSSTFSSTASEKKLCSGASTENSIKRKFRQEPTFLGVEVSERHVNPQKAGNNSLIVKTENKLQAKVMCSDSINCKFMSIWDLVENNYLEKVNPKILLPNTSWLEMERQQPDIDKVSGMLKEDLDTLDVSSKSAVSERPDLNSSYCCPVNMSSSSIYAPVINIVKDTKEMSNNVKEICQNEILDHVLPVHNSQSNTEVANACKDQHFMNTKFDTELDVRCQRSLNLASQGPHNVSREEITEIEVCKNYTLPSDVQKDIKSTSLVVLPDYKLCNPPPGLTCHWAEWSVSQENSSLPAEIQSTKSSLLTDLTPTQLISSCSKPVASNNLTISADLNLKVYTKQQQTQLYLLLCDLQTKIIRLASTMKPFEALNDPLGGAGNCNNLEKMLGNTETITHENELSFDQIEVIVNKLVSKTTQCQNRYAENTFSNLTTQNTSVQNTQNAFPTKQYEVNTVQQNVLSDIEQKDILQRLPVPHSAEQRSHLNKELKTTRNYKQNSSFGQKNMSSEKCLSNKQLNIILRKLPPAPCEEENWSEGIDTETQLSVSQTEDSSKLLSIRTSSHFSLGDNITNRSTAELASSDGKAVRKLSRSQKSNESFPWETSSTNSLYSSRIDKLSKPLCRPARMPEKFQHNEQLNHMLPSRERQNEKFHSLSDLDTAGMSYHSSQICNRHNSTTTKKPIIPYAYARAVFSGFKKVQSSYFDFKLPPPSQRPVLTVSKRMPKITTNSDPEDI